MGLAALSSCIMPHCKSVPIEGCRGARSDERELHQVHRRRVIGVPEGGPIRIAGRRQSAVGELNPAGLGLEGEWIEPDRTRIDGRQTHAYAGALLLVVVPLGHRL